MKKYFLILIGTTIITISLSAQTGGKKREHRNQRSGKFLLFNKTKGNANAFAKGGSRKKRFITKLFSRNKITAGGWIYYKTPGSHKTDHSLFHRYRTKNKIYKDRLQARINKNRAKSRKRGSDTFSRRRY